MTAAASRRLSLCFHGVGTPQRELERGEENVWLESSQFEEMLDQVCGVPDVLITFDDGNRSDLEVALPLLRQRSLTATFFVIANRIDTPGSLSIPDIRELVRNGMTIGTHGSRHREWRGLDADGNREELVEARDIIAAAAGRPVTEAAFPFGAYERRSLAAVRRTGYAHAYSVDGGFSRPDAWLQTRNSLHRADDGGTVRTLVGARHRLRIQPAGAIRRFVKRWR